MTEITEPSEWGWSKRLAVRAVRPWVRTFRRVRRLHESPLARRDRRDAEHMRLLLAFSLSTDSNCVDVGAHQGSVLKEIVRLAPEGHHIAYEPLPHLHKLLEARFPQVDVRRAALSDRNGPASFTYVRTNPAYSGFRERDYPGRERIETIEVRTEVLDSSLPPDYIPQLIKIDVEGAEQQVLEGSIKTIAAHKPVVVFEHGRGSAEYYGTRPVDLFELLCGIAGLRIFDIDGRGPFDLAEFQRIFERGGIWNFVAHA
jgi:FkbM family methyltransferase